MTQETHLITENQPILDLAGLAPEQEHLLYQYFKKERDTTSAELGNKDFMGNLAWYFPLETDAVTSSKASEHCQDKIPWVVKPWKTNTGRIFHLIPKDWGPFYRLIYRPEAHHFAVPYHIRRFSDNVLRFNIGLDS
ncbi:hypothetical protein ACJX0J_010601, partial [Zea mays]